MGSGGAEGSKSAGGDVPCAVYILEVVEGGSGVVGGSGNAGRDALSDALYAGGR